MFKNLSSASKILRQFSEKDKRDEEERLYSRLLEKCFATSKSCPIASIKEKFKQFHPDKIGEFDRIS